MMKLIKDILTELDGETYDISKLLWAFGVVVFIGLSIVAVCKGQLWNPAEYGLGMGSLLAGGGAGVKFKSAGNPPPPPPASMNLTGPG